MSDGPFVYTAVACAECGRVMMESGRVPAVITLGAAEHFAMRHGYYKSEIDQRWYCGECFPDPGDDARETPPASRLRTRRRSD